jgi:hypothetical protein
MMRTISRGDAWAEATALYGWRLLRVDISLLGKGSINIKQPTGIAYHEVYGIY